MKLNFGTRILLSLTIFIVLCSAFLVSINENARTQKIGYGIDITFAGNDWSAFGSDSINASRQWKVLVLTSDANENQKILSAGENELRRIKLECDTINGVQFLLDSTASYQTFIHALDVCMKQKPTWAVPDGNKVMGYYSNANPNHWRRKPFYFVENRHFGFICSH
jgi:hypothetical protein